MASCLGWFHPCQCRLIWSLFITLLQAECALTLVDEGVLVLLLFALVVGSQLLLHVTGYRVVVAEGELVGTFAAGDGLQS